MTYPVSAADFHFWMQMAFLGGCITGLSIALIVMLIAMLLGFGEALKRLSAPSMDSKQ